MRTYGRLLYYAHIQGVLFGLSAFMMPGLLRPGKLCYFTWKHGMSVYDLCRGSGISYGSSFGQGGAQCVAIRTEQFPWTRDNIQKQ